MNYQHKFKEEEIPYGILKKFGLTREMIGDLPQSVLQQVCDENQPTVLSRILLPDLPNLLDGTLCHVRI